MSFTTVTPLSKLLALICFVLFPFIGFYVGTQYQKLLTKPTVQIVKVNQPAPKMASAMTCSDEGKECPDGSYVFQKQPDCSFSACPKEINLAATVSPDILKKAKNVSEQIRLQVSQKTGIPAQQVTILVKNTDDTYSAGTYTAESPGWWIAMKKDSVWVVTSMGTSTPKCSDIAAYAYPKTLVPSCKNASGDIIAR